MNFFFFFFTFFPVKYHQGLVDVQFYYNTVTATLIPDMDAMALFLPSQIQQQQLVGSPETLQN